MSKPWWYDERENVPWGRRKSFVDQWNMVQCERCLFYVGKHRMEEHKKVCDNMTKKELRKLLKQDD